MKLAAILNVFDGTEILPWTLGSIAPHIDLLIVVWQDTSNFGEKYKPDLNLIYNSILPSQLDDHEIILEKFEPKIHHGHVNEMKKRNIGLSIAKQNQCTHYLFLDCDEIHPDFESAKLAYINGGHAGSVLPIFTYFRKATWRLEQPDNYFVPFIHELKYQTEAGGFAGKDYPFYCDPTRRTNETDVVELPFLMHHMSWVRKDIMLKVRNSSARENIYKGSWIKDYNSPALEANPEGFWLEDYKQRITVVPNLFGIPEFGCNIESAHVD